MPRHARRAQARECVVQELLHAHNLDLYTADEHDVADLVREAMPPAFTQDRNPDVLLTTTLPYVCWCILQCLRTKAAQQPASLANKTQLISYIEGTEALIEEVKKRLEHLKNLLLL